MLNALPDRWGFDRALDIAWQRKQRGTNLMTQEEFEELREILSDALFELHRRDVAALLATAYHWSDGFKVEAEVKKFLEGFRDMLSDWEPMTAEVAASTVFSQLMDEAFPSRLDYPVARMVAKHRAESVTR